MFVQEVYQCVPKCDYNRLTSEGSFPCDLGKRNASGAEVRTQHNSKVKL